MTDKLERLLEDYATTPVPVAKTVSGVRIGLVLGGVGIALPALLAGAQVGTALGAADSLRAFLIAAVVVTALASITGTIGARTRLSTYMIIQFSFGRLGSKLVNFTFALSQVGWFAVNAFIFGEAAETIGRRSLGVGVAPYIYVVGGGALMTLTTIFGFKALDKLALFAVPLLFATVMVMIGESFQLLSLEELLNIDGTGELSLRSAVTALAGGIMVGVVLIPDLTRYARSSWDAVIAVLIGLALVEPLVYAAGALPSLASGEAQVLDIMLALGFGAWALGVLVFTSWTTNAVNLYGAGLAMTATLPKAKEWWLVAGAGTLGTALALLNVSDWFIDFLIYQSITFAPVVGIYVSNYYLVHGGKYSLERLNTVPGVGWQAFVAWALGSATSFATEQGAWTLTRLPSLDGAFAAAAIYVMLTVGWARVIAPSRRG